MQCGALYGTPRIVEGANGGSGAAPLVGTSPCNAGTRRGKRLAKATHLILVDKIDRGAAPSATRHPCPNAPGVLVCLPNELINSGMAAVKQSSARFVRRSHDGLHCFIVFSADGAPKLLNPFNFANYMLRATDGDRPLRSQWIQLIERHIP